MTLLRIATRRSALALWQAEHIKKMLMQAHEGLEVELVTMVTKGDKILDTPLAKVGGKGLFVKELEHALLEGRADIAVHSMKDVPVDFPEGLMLHTICEREDPTDAFVSNLYDSIDHLPSGAIVGTSSFRRQCQIKAHRSDLEVADLRGNVNTRLDKLDNGDYDAIVLASSGLKRLDMNYRIKSQMDAKVMLPAVGQGALGIECRENDPEVQKLLAPLHHEESQICVLAERAFNKKLNGGCQVPIGCFAKINAAGELELEGMVGSLDGQQIIRKSLLGSVQESESLGTFLAEQVLAAGADKILAELYQE